MKILFLSHYFPPEVNAPASRTYEHCLRWAREGHDVTVVTCNPNCPDGVLFDGYRNRLWPQVENVDGIRVVRVWSYLAPNAGFVKRIANFLSYCAMAILASLRLERPDVVIATSPQFFCGWAGVWVKRLKRAPFVLEIRDIWPESIEAVGAMKRGLAIRYLEWLEKRMYRAADYIVAVGAGYRDNILRKVDAADRIDVITNGVDLAKFVPGEKDSAFVAKWGLEKKFVCSYVGTIGMAHGLEVTLEAAQFFKDRGRDDVRFLIVGDGASRQRLADEAERRGLSQMVVFTGRMPREEMPQVLDASDACLVHLKKCDLFTSVIPSKIFETMAIGKPIIMGVQGEACAIVERAGAGLTMTPDSASELVACIERLSADPQYAASLGGAAREFVSREYDREKLAMRFLALLESLVERKRSKSRSSDVALSEAVDRSSREEASSGEASSREEVLEEALGQSR